MRAAAWWTILALACAPEPSPPPPAAPVAQRAGPSPAELAAAAAERALAHEAQEAAQTSAPAADAAPNEPEVQILRGRGSAPSASKTSGSKTSLYGGARWLQGRADGRGLELVVFWETWCGYCRTELPKLQALSARVRGVDVVGLTTLSKGSDDAGARRVLDAANVRFPIAVVPESTKLRAGVNGIPHALVVRDGRVLWQGHPAALDEATLARWARGD